MIRRVQSLAEFSAPSYTSFGGNVQCRPVECSLANQLLVVRGHLHGVPVRCLIDCGATHNFVSNSFVANHGLPTSVLPSPMPVLLANGMSVAGSEYQIQNVQLTLSEHTWTVSLLVTDLARYDVVLGKPWLTVVNPRIDFSRNLLWIDSWAVPLKANLVLSDQPVKPSQDLATVDLKPSCNNNGSRTPELDFVISGKRARKDLRMGADGFLVLVSSMERVASCCSNFLESSPHVKVDGEQRQDLHILLEKHQACFPDKLPSELPPRRSVEHEIDLEPGRDPPSRPAIRLSKPHMDELQRQLADLLDRGYIEPSKSPFGAPVFFVRKADGSLRLVCDWRQLNKITIKNKACLPNADDLFDTVLGAKYFSKLDLASGYHQVRIRDSDVPKTAINTALGHFQYRVMGFGLTNAPATFMSLMNEVLRPFLRKCVVVFLDDILIYSNSWKEHLQHLDAVLSTLEQNQLYCKPAKCTFGTSFVRYLGHILTGTTIAPDPGKLSAVRDWPLPKSVADVRRFLGFSNYFRRFIKSYSSISRPLEEITGKHSRFQWSPEREKAFHSLKTCLLSAPVLQIADTSKPLRVTTDASDFAVGGVLEQETYPGQWNPVAFTSRSLKASERNYIAQERETLAVVHALQTWKLYLYGHFTLCTDNQGVTFWQSKNHISRREARWFEFLSEFDFTVQKKSGHDNIADPLSRRPDLRLHAVETVIEEDSSLAKIISAGYKNDKFLSPIIKRLQSKQESSVHEKYRWELNRLYLIESDRLRLCIPVGEVRLRLLESHHDCISAAHPGRDRTYSRLSRNFYWPGMAKDVKRYVKSCDACQRFKNNHGKSTLLQPLPVPGRPWDDIGMDFVTSLPRTKKGFDAVLTFVDRLTKCVHFVPTSSSVSAKETADLYLCNVFRLHGLSRSIVCDRDPRFTAMFFQEVFSRLGVELKLSTSNHPQTDGCTERIHRVLGDVLRTFVNHNQDNCDDLLPFCEFAINDMENSSIKTTPFFLNFGQHPKAPADCMLSGPWNGSSGDNTSTSWLACREEAISVAKDCMLAAQARQMLYACYTMLYALHDIFILHIIIASPFLCIYVPLPYLCHVSTRPFSFLEVLLRFVTEMKDQTVCL